MNYANSFNRHSAPRLETRESPTELPGQSTEVELKQQVARSAARPMQSGELASKNRWSSDTRESIAIRHIESCRILLRRADRTIRPRSSHSGGSRAWGARWKIQPSAPQRRLRDAWKIEPEVPEPDTRVAVDEPNHGGDPRLAIESQRRTG